MLRPSAFETDLKTVLKKYPKSARKIESAISDLEKKSDIGDRYPGFGSIEIRKVRIPLPEYNIGKSDGLRLLFMVKPEKADISLLTIYQKNKHKSETDVVKTIIERLNKIEAELDS